MTRTQICEVCKEEKPLTEFNATATNLTIRFDAVCTVCRMAGRKSIKQLIEEYSKHGGRPRIYLPFERIKQLREVGLGYKAIATQLRKEGYQVTFILSFSFVV